MISHMLFFPIWYVLKHSNVGNISGWLDLIISDHVALFVSAWLSSICTPTAFRIIPVFISVCTDYIPFTVLGLMM